MGLRQSVGDRLWEAWDQPGPDGGSRRWPERLQSVVNTPQDLIRQRSLQLLGIWPGEADGKARPETRQAVEELQRRNNLAASGIFDTVTVNAMKKMIADRFPR